MKKIWIGLAIISVALTGCASGFRQFYIATTEPNVVAVERAAPASETPQVLRASYPIAQALNQAHQHGYEVMGYSSFNGSASAGSTDDAQEEGERIGADMVLVFSPTYTDTRHAVIPFQTPTTQTTYYTGSATAFGPEGSATAYDNGVATSYGQTTTYVPLSVNRYDFLAVYLFKAHVHTGMYLTPLSDSERQALGSNYGAVVSGLVNDSPAFDAGVLPGDIVMAIEGLPLSAEDAESPAVVYLRTHYGQPVTFTIVRNGVTLKKTLTPLP